MSVMKTKEQNLVRELQKMDKLAVAYSGGIDSSYLLKKALDTLGFLMMSLIKRLI